MAAVILTVVVYNTIIAGTICNIQDCVLAVTRYIIYQWLCNKYNIFNACMCAKFALQTKTKKVLLYSRERINETK